MICFRGRGRGQGELPDAVVFSLMFGCCVLGWQLLCSMKPCIGVAAHATHSLGTHTCQGKSRVSMLGSGEFSADYMISTFPHESGKKRYKEGVQMPWKPLGKGCLKNCTTVA